MIKDYFNKILYCTISMTGLQRFEVVIFCVAFQFVEIFYVRQKNMKIFLH